MGTLWQSLESQYNDGTDDGIDDIENIRNGLTLMTKYLCRYLKLVGKSLVFRNASDFIEPLIAERVFMKQRKLNPCGVAWRRYEFRNVNRRISTRDGPPAGEFAVGALEDDEDF